MNEETQNIEWKESWKDDFFKVLCAFANAQGGTLYVGIDDQGDVKHLENSRKLLQDVPNQARDLLGIIVDVDLRKSNDHEYLEIRVDKHPIPINFRGKYYYRSGNTTQELKGSSLSKFLFDRQGKKWDSFPLLQIKPTDLKRETFRFFREKAIKSNRLEAEALEVSDFDLLERLQLYIDDGKTLSRAAILLFHPNPDEFIAGAFIKIGFFNSDSDLRFQDEVRGNLFEQVEKAFELLITKYSNVSISYRGISREEKHYFPLEAIREALCNAIVHKNYEGGIPIQISVYSNQLIIWNEGQLPDNWTIERLLEKHPSKPFNPAIANAFFRAGYIESWGRGIQTIISMCKDHKISPPLFFTNNSEFQVQLIRHTEEELKKRGLNKHSTKIILHIQKKGFVSNSEVQRLCGISKATATRYLNELENHWVTRIGTTGRKTRYVLKGS